jgi:hypothetical protein
MDPVAKAGAHGEQFIKSGLNDTAFRMRRTIFALPATAALSKGANSRGAKYGIRFSARH